MSETSVSLQCFSLLWNCVKLFRMNVGDESGKKEMPVGKTHFISSPLRMVRLILFIGSLHITS